MRKIHGLLHNINGLRDACAQLMKVGCMTMVIYIALYGCLVGIILSGRFPSILRIDSSVY